MGRGGVDIKININLKSSRDKLYIFKKVPLLELLKYWTTYILDIPRLRYRCYTQMVSGQLKYLCHGDIER